MTELKCTPAALERYAMYWSLVKMVVAAVSLFFGATPIVYEVIGYGVTPLLTLAWIVSGVAAAYLGYRFYTNEWNVFGGKDKKDITAVSILIVTGINLGVTGISENIGMGLAGMFGMTIESLLFKLTALMYLAVAVYLYQRFHSCGNVFGDGTTNVDTAVA